MILFRLIYPASRADIASIGDPALANAVKELTAMDGSILTLPLNESSFDHLSEAELSSLLDLIQSQVEYHRDELARLRPLLHRLQGQTPNQPFLDFIENMDSL